MENLLFCLNATVPIFLTMMLGCLFKKIGWIDELFTKRLNKFVFQVALPALLFEDLATVDLAEVWDMGYVVYCFAATFLGIGICYLISLLLKDKSIQGEFVQASYRSSAALMGIAIIQNIYGNAGMAPLMIIGTVPLYNVMAVVILSILKPERGKVDKALLLKKGNCNKPDYTRYFSRYDLVGTAPSDAENSGQNGFQCRRSGDPAWFDGAGCFVRFKAGCRKNQTGDCCNLYQADRSGGNFSSNWRDARLYT